MAKLDVKKLKSQAEKYRGKGKLEKALEIYQEIEDAGQADAKVLQRMAEILIRLGEEEEASQKYRRAMKKYLEDGFLIRAVAVGKILQELAPDDQDLQKEVQEVLSRRHPKPIGKIQPVKIPADKLETQQTAEVSAPEERKEEAEEEIRAERKIESLLFEPLGEEEFSQIYQMLRSVKVPKGVKICREGEEGDSIFIIVDGEVEVSKTEPETGEEKILARLGPGDFFGEFGYFIDGRRHASVTALSDLELLEIAKADMDEITQQYPQVKEVMLKFYKERVLDNLLAFSPLTKGFSQEERKKLIEKFKFQEYQAGEVVVAEGEEGDAMFLIKSGKTEVTTIDPRDKRRLTLARLGPGDFFGEVSLIKNKPRTATVSALTPLEVMVIDRASFQELAQEHPEIVNLLEQTIEKRVEDTIKRIREKG